MVGENNKNLGMISNRDGGMRDSGYDITIEWQTLIVTGVATSTGSHLGTSTFYVNGMQVGTADRVGSGTQTWTIGASTTNPPGYISVAGVLNQELTTAEITALHSALTGTASVASCSKCPTGKYTSSAGNGKKCDKCAAGYYGSAAATCTECPSGKYKASSGNGDETEVCTECTAGNYGPPGQDHCARCPAGYYSSQGSSVCTACPSGKSTAGSETSGTDSSVCTKCPQGTYSSDGLVTSGCIACGAAYSTVDTGTAGTDASTCTVCAPGYTGTSGSGTSGCAACPSSAPYTAAGNAQTCTTLDCNSVDSDGYVLVPAPVSTIGSNAFKDCKNLWSVLFTSGSQLTTIGNKAFSNSGLNNINLPSTVTKLGISAFESTNIEELIIPNSVTFIDSNAFKSCRFLHTVKFHCKSVARIKSSAFSDCSELVGIYLPQTVLYTGDKVSMTAVQ